MRLRDQVSIAPFSMILKRGLVVGLGGFDGGMERAKLDRFFFNHYFSFPPAFSLRVLAICYAAKASLIVALYSLINHLLRQCCKPEIIPRIIKSIAVFVVDCLSFGGLAHDYLMEFYALLFPTNSFPFRSKGITNSAFNIEKPLFGFMVMPIYILDFIVIAIVNERVLSVLQWNQYHNLIIP